MAVKEENTKSDKLVEPADFEKAVHECHYGSFNYLLLIIAIPACSSSVFETSAMSYILPSAECDLKLDLFDKGLLNAITYAGMITSAIFWGFLADAIGRKKLLVWGFILDSLCFVLSSLSQNTLTLLIFKYFGGFLACGPFAVLMSYLAEFHGVKYRSTVMIVIGAFYSLATLSLPLLAWAILPQDWNFYYFNNKFVIHPWQIFIAICSLPSLIAGICIIFLPESPKFLMSQGRNEEAMEVFQKIFAMNTKKSKDQYPVKKLVCELEPKSKIFIIESHIDSIPSSINLHGLGLKIELKENEDKKCTVFEKIRFGLRQLRPMFEKPNLGYGILVCAIQFFILMGLNTIRLWLPQLFTSIANFEELQISQNSTQSSNLCIMLEYGINQTKVNLNINNEIECEVKIADGMYINTIIVGVSGLIGYFAAGNLIRKVGNKNIMLFSLTIAGLSALLLYWAKNSTMTVILSSICVTVGSISSTALLGVIVNLFPTSLRTMIVSICMMFGRFGAFIGNFSFPVFMAWGCIPPFLFIGLVLLGSTFLTFFLPVTHKNALK